MLPLRVREDLLCSTSTHPSYGRGRPLVLPIVDDAFLPVVVSLQAKPPCDLAVIAMAEGERWVRRDCRCEFPFRLVGVLTGSKPIPCPRRPPSLARMRHRQSWVSRSPKTQAPP